MKILITGATGAIGSQLSKRIANEGNRLFVLERYVTGRFTLDPSESVRTVYGDVRDHKTIRRILEEVQPEVVIHLAAISPVAYSYDHPQEVMETNLNGTINLAEACLDKVPDLSQFLFASTSETYGNGPLPKTEETAQNPNSPYSVSKHAAEKYLLYLRDAYEFPVTILRPFNTYGRKDNKHFVVERMVTQMLSGDKVVLGDPEPVRDLLYIDDHVTAYLTCLSNRKAIGEVLNFCTSRGISIRELSELAGELIGFKGDVVWHRTPERPLDIKTLYGSFEKAQRLLGWKPKVTLEQGLSLTIEYWRAQSTAH